MERYNLKHMHGIIAIFLISLICCSCTKGLYKSDKISQLNHLYNHYNLKKINVEEIKTLYKINNSIIVNQSFCKELKKDTVFFSSITFDKPEDLKFLQNIKKKCNDIDLRNSIKNEIFDSIKYYYIIDQDSRLKKSLNIDSCDKQSYSFIRRYDFFNLELTNLTTENTTELYVLILHNLSGNAYEQDKYLFNLLLKGYEEGVYSPSDLLSVIYRYNLISGGDINIFKEIEKNKFNSKDKKRKLLLEYIHRITNND